METLRSAPLRRDWRTTLLFVAGGVTCGVFAVGTWNSGQGWLAVLLGIVAAICFALACFGSRSAPCPHCGTKLTQLTLLARERCPQCGCYVEVQHLRAWEVAPDRVLDAPGFSILLPERFVMPEICCACGLPATRREEVSLQLAPGPSPVIRVGGDIHCSLDAPHCDLHSGRARLDREVFSPPVSSDVLLGLQPAAIPVTVLKVRSYAFCLEFLRLNPDCARSL